jgi:hypothetical protein
VIEISDFEGTPVFIYHGGRYPTLLDDNDAPIERYIDIADFYDGWYVRAMAGKLSGGRAIDLPVGVAPTLDAAKLLYAEAVKAIEAAPDLYAEADKLASPIASYHGPISRSDYERLAKEYEFEPEPDEELTEWGDFSFPEYTLAQLPRFWINQRRAFAYKDELNDINAAKSSRAAAFRTAVIEDLRTFPILRTETRLLVIGSPNEYLDGDTLYTVVHRGAARRITEDDPSVYGSHLLGHEGELAEMITLEVRCLPVPPDPGM